jgi:hypothetical protein
MDAKKQKSIAPKKRTSVSAGSKSKTATPKVSSAESPKKRAKTEEKVLEISGSDADGSSADIYIISSKACQAFKIRANGLEKMIKAKKPGVTMFINEEKKLGSKPDKGSFVVKVKGKTLVELIAMPRPFTQMKALDMEDLAAQILKEL